MRSLTLDDILWVKKRMCFHLIIYLFVYSSVSSTLSLRLLKPGNLQKRIIRFCCSDFLNYYSSGETFMLAEVDNCSPQDRNKTSVIHARRLRAWVHLLAAVTNTKVGSTWASSLSSLGERWEPGACPCQPSWCCSWIWTVCRGSSTNLAGLLFACTVLMTWSESNLEWFFSLSGKEGND